MDVLLCVLMIFASANALQFQEVMSFKAPLTGDKFEHWDAEGSTIFLKNKIILAPEGKD